MKKNQSLRCLLWELNNKINQFVYCNDLFAGGCCYAAYVLARELTKLGIQYETIIWQYLDILKVNDFNMAINGKGVSHVAIKVKIGPLEDAVIGTCQGIDSFFFNTGYDVNVRTYQGITPEMLLDGYKNNNWNSIYDRHCNGPLSRAITRICKKYSAIV